MRKAGYSKFRAKGRGICLALFCVLGSASSHAAPSKSADLPADGKVLEFGPLRASAGVFDLRATKRAEIRECVVWQKTPAKLDAAFEADGNWSVLQDGKVLASAEASKLGDFRFVRGFDARRPLCISLKKPEKGAWRMRMRLYGSELSDLQPSVRAVKVQTPVALDIPQQAGIFRTGYISPRDGQPREVALYLPRAYRRSAQTPLPVVVALHGMNGSPMAYLRYVLGGFVEEYTQAWHDRTPLSPLPDVQAIVVAPSAFGNAFYRGPGEEDVMDALNWVKANYAVDDSRISITGASMGGTGAASVALRHPDVFSHIQALCGYHSYFVRRDLPEQMAPWERFLAEERSNTFWAPNGRELPLHLVQGTKDTPMSNGRSLVKKYEELGLSVRAEWPALGHNVWGYTYANLAGVNWLLEGKRVLSNSFSFHTARTRYAGGRQVFIHRRNKHDAWANVSVKHETANAFSVDTTNVSELRLERDKGTVGPLLVTLDGTEIRVPTEATAQFVKQSGLWTHAPSNWAPDGPFMDVYHTPITVVYGSQVPGLTDVSKRVAEHWARKPSFRRWNESEDMQSGSGWSTEPGIRYPLMSDVEFIAAAKKLGPGQSLLLVGSEASNRVLAELGASLPFRVLPDGIMLKGKRVRGKELGAIFIYPRPDDPTGYIAVVSSDTSYGLQRSLSAPDLLPDFMIYDSTLSPTATDIWMGEGKAVSAGFFNADWSIP